MKGVSVPRLFLSLFVMLMAVHGTAELYASRELEFEHITSEQGLSENAILSILQDSRGFLWFGTADGLNRYDGHRFVVYRPDENDPFSLNSNRITALAEDGSGIIWIGTVDGGLNFYLRETDQFFSLKHDPEHPSSLGYDDVRALLVDSKGQVWAGTWGGGLNRLKPDGKTFVRFTHDPEDPNSLGDDHVSALQEGLDGSIWIGTPTGLNRYNPETRTWNRYIHQSADSTSLGADNIVSLYRDKRGDLWVGTERGLDRLKQGVENHFLHYSHDPHDPGSLTEGQVYSLTQDHLGRIWIGTSGGLNRYDRDMETFVQYVHDPSKPKTLSYNGVVCVFEDRSAVLWAGTPGRGLNRCRLHRKGFSHYRTNPDDVRAVSNNFVWAVSDDQAGNVWFGSRGGLFRVNREKQGEISIQPVDLLEDSSKIYPFWISCIEDDPFGNVWIVYYEHGLYRYHVPTRKTTRFFPDPEDPAKPSSHQINYLYTDRTGDVWLGLKGGLINRYDQKTGRFIRYDYDPTDRIDPDEKIVFAIYEDSYGELWLGTRHQGLYRFRMDDQRKPVMLHNYRHAASDPHSLSGNRVSTITEEDRTAGKFLWVGTFGGGLSRLDRETGTFRTYRINDGLPNDIIHGLMADRSGYLWISTNNSLCRFDPRTEVFRPYDTDDGLQSSEFNQGAYHQSRWTGEILVGGINGVNTFLPEKIIDNPHAPQMAITDFKLYNESVAMGAEINGRVLLEQPIEETKQITLSYKDKVITFEYAGLHYSVPEKNQYAYIMEGLEERWNYVGNRRFATYTNLPPGDYAFRVRGANSDGVWNEQAISLAITVTPPFWSTWWFRITGMALLLALVISLYKARTATIKRRNVQLKEIVENRTFNLRMTNEKLKKEIAERLRMEEEINNHVVRLEAAVRDLESFSYSVSHDLRAPLRAIDGFSRVLLEDHGTRLNKEGKRHLKTICHNAERMGLLIDDLLRFSRLGQKEFNNVEIDMDALFREVVQELRNLDTNRPLNHKAGACPAAYGDRAMIRQVLVNLLTNAVKFSKPNQPIQIETGGYISDNEHVYFVKDKGVGFDMKYVDKLFGVFQRLHSSVDFEGTGIGLALVHRIIHRHRGRVWAEGAVDEGASFYFSLPLRR